MVYTERRNCKCRIKLTGATNDGAREKRKGGSLKFLQRCLSVAAIAVSIVVATPAVASSPDMMMARTPAVAKFHAKLQIKAYGWGKRQWVCLSAMWGKESAWNPNARNNTPVRVYKAGKVVRLHAGGVPQILGLNPRTSVPRQVQAGLTYIHSRYGSPCHAWTFWQRHKYY